MLVVSELSYLPPSVVVDGVAVVITCQAGADSDSDGIILITLSSNKLASQYIERASRIYIYCVSISSKRYCCSRTCPFEVLYTVGYGLRNLNDVMYVKMKCLTCAESSRVDSIMYPRMLIKQEAQLSLRDHASATHYTGG